MQSLELHEKELFASNLVREGDWSLLELEQVLLQLAVSKDCIEGLLYFLNVPSPDGSSTVRWVKLIAFCL